MEAVGILIASVLSAQLVMQIVFFVLSYTSDRRARKRIDNLQKESNDISYKSVDLLELAVARQRKHVEHVWARVSEVTNINNMMSGNIKAIYELLIGASDGSLSPEAVVQKAKEYKENIEKFEKEIQGATDK